MSLRAARLAGSLRDLMLIPGPCGSEDRVRRHLAAALSRLEVPTWTDRPGNLVATLPGREQSPTVVLVAAMDQPGFMVRHIAPDGTLRLTRMGHMPQGDGVVHDGVICTPDADVPGIVTLVGNPAPRSAVQGTDDAMDAGFSSAAQARDTGVEIGAPVVWQPHHQALAAGVVSGTAAGGRGACAVLLEVARALAGGAKAPTVHVVFSVQQHLNRQAVLRTLAADICISVAAFDAGGPPASAGGPGDICFGGGAVVSLFGRDGWCACGGGVALVPHPALSRLFTLATRDAGGALQRSVGGILPGAAYPPGDLAGLVAGFGVRHLHGPHEMCDLADLDALVAVIVAALARVGPNFSLNRDDYT